jgi:hypothetical protein
MSLDDERLLRVRRCFDTIIVRRFFAFALTPSPLKKLVISRSERDEGCGEPNRFDPPGRDHFAVPFFSRFSTFNSPISRSSPWRRSEKDVDSAR